jgi:AcrR family transcriptional regulator
VGDRLFSGPAYRFPDPAAELEAFRQALLDLCLERGYPSLSLLLERSGLGRPAFERHYEDLESCLCDVYARARDDLFGRVWEAIADRPSWGDRIRTAAYVFLGFLREAISRATAEAIGGGIFGQIYAAVDAGAPLRADGIPRLMHAAVLPYLDERAAAAELDLPVPEGEEGLDVR